MELNDVQLNPKVNLFFNEILTFIYSNNPQLLSNRLLYTSVNTSQEFTENIIEKYSEKLLKAVAKKMQNK